MGVQDPRTPLAALIGADFSALSITPSNADTAPGSVRSALPRFATWDAYHRIDIAERFVVRDLGDAGASHLAWNEAYTSIAEHAIRARAVAPFTVALGGDHSVTWPLVAAFAHERGRVGLVQLDVHHDVRPLDNGPSNGTPVRGLVEYGVLNPRDIVQIGIHPFANRSELTRWCDEHEVRRFGLADAVRQGIETVCTQALVHLSDCDALYLTVDIDVLDRSFAPGTVAALPGGLSPAQLAEAVTTLVTSPRVCAIDIVEFDPSRDVQSTTAYNVAQVVMTALSALARRQRR